TLRCCSEATATEAVRLAELLVMAHRTAGRRRERSSHDLAAHGRQPPLELGLRGEGWHGDHLRFDRPAAGAGAPGAHGAVERADARADHVAVRYATTPAVPRAVLLPASIDAPAAERLDRPVGGGIVAGRAGEARADGVEQCLRDVHDL